MHLAQLREQEGLFTRQNVRIVVVTFENDYFARSYIEETGLAWPILVDTERATYKRYGMLAASWRDIWGLKTWRAYFKALMHGEKLHRSEGDIYQRGGDVLIDPDGIVRLHHIGEGPADRPPVEVILEKAGALQGD